MPTVARHLKPAPDLCSVPVAAKRLGVHPDTLYRLAKAGQFAPAILIGARWRVSVPLLEKMLHERPAA